MKSLNIINQKTNTTCFWSDTKYHCDTKYRMIDRRKLKKLKSKRIRAEAKKGFYYAKL